MEKLGSIVVGIDFSPASAAALAQAVRMAGWNRARLLAVHIIDTLVLVELQEALSPMVQGIQDAMLRDANEAWAGFAKDIPGMEGVEFHVAINNQLTELLRQVRDRSADLLVLGVRGASAGMLGLGGAGGLASDAVRRCPVKVMLVRETHRGPFKNVVVGVDFSSTSKLALEAAARVVAQDDGVLNIVHVFNPPWGRFHYRAPTEATSPQFQHQFRQELQKRLEEFCIPSDPTMVWAKPRFHLVESAGHGAGLTEFTRRTGADLVVLGTRGRTNLRDVLIGSTAERVLRDAPCSILAIKPEA